MLFCLLMLYCGIAYGQSAPSFVIGNDPKPIDKKWMKVNDMSDEFDKEFNDSRWHREPV